MDLRVEPVEWAVTYPVNPHDPIGVIRRRRDGFHAWLGEEYLGVHPDRDAAVEAVWARLVERSHVDHELAARTHGGDERSGRTRRVGPTLRPGSW